MKRRMIAKAVRVSAALGIGMAVAVGAVAWAVYGTHEWWAFSAVLGAALASLVFVVRLAEINRQTR
ncbi:hypothetical protein [Streptomyces thinghirensis]|uniref:Secreted protein n=1 Tax=Streptomyces thinghirensis TaxID=551547 RepID=A0ABP9TGJ2_9ACTN